MLKNYTTILRQGEIELVEKKSRFLAIARPVENEAKAKAFLEEVRKKYWDATHHVYAWQLGERDEIQKFSDDGEPQGTAGLPILDVLRTEKLKNTMIVVTRYFGGTLLGTGGLVRAYGKSAKQAVIAAGICNVIFYSVISAMLDYSLSGKLQYELLQIGAILKDTIYTQQVEFIILIEKEQEAYCIEHITNVSGGKASIKQLEDKFGVWQDGKLELIE